MRYAALLLIALAVFLAGCQQAGVSQPAAPEVFPTVNASMSGLSQGNPVMGSPNATVTIAEFSDFECPFCQKFYRETLPQIEKDYISTGKAKLVFIQYPLVQIHSDAEKAAEASLCADEQGKFWEMHNKLFSGGVTGGPSQFKQYAQQLGLNEEEFSQCLDLSKTAPQVQKDLAIGQGFGIQGTPTFIINGELVGGARPYATFKQVIDSKLQG